MQITEKKQSIHFNMGVNTQAKTRKIHPFFFNLGKGSEWKDVKDSFRFI